MNRLSIYYQRKSYLKLTSFVRTGEWRLLYKHVIIQLGISRGDFWSMKTSYDDVQNTT